MLNESRQAGVQSDFEFLADALEKALADELGLMFLASHSHSISSLANSIAFRVFELSDQAGRASIRLKP
jgi:hypothetical protein